MPKRSTKSKSKRMTLRQKYKIQKKVREHHRKKRKELKKAGGKARQPKDPGIPAQWPFKEELVKELAWKRQQILAQEKQKRDERKRAREEAAMDVEQDPDASMAQLQSSADRAQADFEQRKRSKPSKEGGKSDTDNSRRAFYREFRRVAEASDVVIQVLDARDPEGCRCPDVESYIRSLDPNKKIVLLLNKMDLVPREVGEAWLKYYRQELPTVAFKASTQQQARGLKQGKAGGAAAGGAGAEAGGACLGADTLLQLLKNYARNAGLATSITVGVVGVPNVGKSSLINSLKRARVAQVGNTPGVTRGIQEVHLDKHIKLLDSPGIVFSSAASEAAAALRNAIKVERLPDPLTPVAEILRRLPAKQLQALYKVPAFQGAEEFLQHIAAARGKLKKGGVADVQAAARIVLQDWNDGRIPFFTRPPSRGNQEHEAAALVASWAADFDADRVFASEARAVLPHLTSLEDASGAAFFEAASAGRVAVALDEMLAQQEDGGRAADDGVRREDDDDEGPASMDGEEEEEEEEYGAPSSSGRGTAAAAAAAGARKDPLYSEDGQHNPHAARAERKQQKKQRRRDAAAAAAAMEAAVAGARGGMEHDGDEEEEDEDFDFAAANEGLPEARGQDAGAGSGSGSGDDDDDGGGEDEGEEGEDDDDEEYGAAEGDDDEDVDQRYLERMEG